jgi:LAO/AO transport system kinase
VFIRSMATRGHVGGLALATPEAVRLLDAVGLPWVLVETVGVGQVEVEVAGAADTTLVVVTPGWGDSVQASKAGLLEVADVFVVNKADRPGVEETRRDLEQMLELSPSRTWRPPVVSCVAVKGEGVTDVWDAVGAHREHLVASGTLEQRRAVRTRDELRDVVAGRMARRAADAMRDGEFADLAAAVVDRRVDPYTAADEILDRLLS